MVIRDVKKVRVRDVEMYAWSGLAQFQNTEHTADTISTLHKLLQKDRPNAKKQAEQIKFCLAQAKEYFVASKAVTLATRPVMQYYGVCLLYTSPSPRD